MEVYQRPPGRPLPGGLRGRNPASSWWRKRACRCRRSPAGRSATTTSTGRHGVCNLFLIAAPQAGLAHGQGDRPAHETGFCRGPCATWWTCISRRPRRWSWSATTSTRTIPASCTRPVAPAEARRIAARLEWHYTPKHGSWLNMAEIEFAALGTQCLDRRIERRGRAAGRDCGLGCGSATPWASPCTGSGRPRMPAPSSCTCTLHLSEVGLLSAWRGQM